jgi:hypothetical protein
MAPGRARVMWVACSLGRVNAMRSPMARTIFWILKSVKRAGKSSFWMMRAYLRAACRACRGRRAGPLGYRERTRAVCSTAFRMPLAACASRGRAMRIGVAHLLLRFGARHYHLARLENERRPANAMRHGQLLAHAGDHATGAWQRGIWPRLVKTFVRHQNKTSLAALAFLSCSCARLWLPYAHDDGREALQKDKKPRRCQRW